jgi:glycosyltransferase involved in cell wall biosynthesis
VSGAVGIIADSLARYTNFYYSLENMRRPVNTSVIFRVGADRGRSRNRIVEAALENGSEWVLFLDDDVTFSPDLLLTLLSREQPVVASLYLQRTDPFLPIAFAEKDENGDYWPLDLGSCPQNGLVSVRAAGTGGMLIRSEVFRQIHAPWFVHTTKQSEDIYFCDRLAEADIPLFVDMDARLGHMGAFAIFPDWADGWAAGISVSPTMKVVLPIQSPVPTG